VGVEIGVTDGIGRFYFFTLPSFLAPAKPKLLTRCILQMRFLLNPKNINFEREVSPIYQLLKVKGGNTPIKFFDFLR
jgi:hypothetical protein